MSEFKYACPVCGQHMMCDASQAGSVVECPTCFQKINVPQAPSSQDQKFILTGSKVVDKKNFTRGRDDSPAVVQTNKIPGTLVVVLILSFMGAVAGAIYWATIIHPRHASAQTASVPVQTGAGSVTTKPRASEKANRVAPPANDANWTLSLGTNAIAAMPVAGRIHGQDFIVERASFRDGSLTLRDGSRGALEFGVQINFGGAQAESLSGQAINVSADADRAAKISLRWKGDDGAVQKENYNNGYAMRLEFGALANNRLPGKIYLCLPDAEKSYLMGTFNADARKPRPKAPPTQ